MTKAELINHVHASLEGHSKKDTAEIVQVVFDSLADAIKDSGRFQYPDFGTFNVKERAARQGRNPRTGDAMNIAASKTVSFKPAPKLKDNV